MNLASLALLLSGGIVITQYFMDVDAALDRFADDVRAYVERPLLPDVPEQRPGETTEEYKARLRRLMVAEREASVAESSSLKDRAKGLAPGDDRPLWIAVSLIAMGLAGMYAAARVRQRFSQRDPEDAR
ncbi:MAG: hypothetical protein AAGD14_09205 [Planctomycetota bacterium]